MPHSIRHTSRVNKPTRYNIHYLQTFLKNNLWGILWGLLIILLTSLPGRVFPRLPSFIDLLQPDKLVHLVIFSIFVFLLILGFRKEGTPQLILRNPVAIALTLGITIGAITEIIQGTIIPMRAASPYDFLANVAGCMLGWAMFSLFKRRLT